MQEKKTDGEKSSESVTQRISARLVLHSKSVLSMKILLPCLYERELMQLQHQSFNKKLQFRDLVLEHCTFIPSKSSLDPFTAKPSFARLLVAPASADISQGEYLLQDQVFSSLRSYLYHKCKKN